MSIASELLIKFAGRWRPETKSRRIFNKSHPQWRKSRTVTRVGIVSEDEMGWGYVRRWPTASPKFRTGQTREGKDRRFEGA